MVRIDSWPIRLEWLRTEALRTVAEFASAPLEESEAAAFWEEWEDCKSDQARRKLLIHKFGSAIDVRVSGGAQFNTDNVIQRFRRLLPFASSTFTQSSDEDTGTPVNVFAAIASQRTDAGSGRLRLGLVFMLIGLIFLISNIYVLPKMAEQFSKQAERPLTKSVNDLQNSMNRFSESVSLTPDFFQNVGPIVSPLRSLNEGLGSFVSVMKRLDEPFAQSPVERLSRDQENEPGPRGASHRNFKELHETTQQLARKWSLNPEHVLEETTTPNADLADDGDPDVSLEENYKGRPISDGELRLTAYLASNPSQPSAAVVAKGFPEFLFKEGPSFVMISKPSTDNTEEGYSERLRTYQQALSEYKSVAAFVGPERDASYELLKKAVENLTDYGHVKGLDFEIVPIDLAVQPDVAGENSLDSTGDYSKLGEILDLSRTLVEEYRLFNQSANLLLGRLSKYRDESREDESRSYNLIQVVREADDGMNLISEFGEDWTSLRRSVEATLPALEAGKSLQDTFKEFIPPYAYLVLGLAAMFLTFGLSSVVRWARMKDEQIDDTRAIWRTGTLAEAAAVAAHSGIDPTELVRGAAQFGQGGGGSRGDQIVHTPFLNTAKEGFDILKSSSRKNE